MSKRNLTVLISILSILIFSSNVLCEENKDKPLSKFKKFQESFKPAKEIFEETISKISGKEENALTEEMGIDRQTLKVVMSLKNPFIPQLPIPDIPDIETGPTENADIEIIDEIIDIEETEKPKQTKELLPLPDFQISGLVWNSDYPQAIVNDEIVSVGDVINDCTITNISKQGVEVIFQEEAYTIEP